MIWNTLNIIQLWNNRAARFHAGLLFASVAIGNTLARNSILFANDAKAILPRCMNTWRRQSMCAVIGFATCPWKIEANATRFLAFLNGYTIFLSPITEVLLTDFPVVWRARHFRVCHLCKPRGIYWSRDGVRAMAAFTAGMVPQLSSMVYQIDPRIGGISRGHANVISLSWIEAFFLALGMILLSFGPLLLRLALSCLLYAVSPDPL